MFLIITSILLFCGCINENTDQADFEKFIGSWEFSINSETTTFIFYKNESLFSKYYDNNTGEKHEGWGNFEVKNNKLYCSTTHGHDGKSESYCYDYEFSNDNNFVTLSSSNLATVTLRKN